MRRTESDPVASGIVVTVLRRRGDGTFEPPRHDAPELRHDAWTVEELGGSLELEVLAVEYADVVVLSQR